MQKVSVSLREEHIDKLDAIEEAGDADSRSEALRQILDEYDQVREECETLRTECDRLRNRRDELRNQLREANRTNDQVEELVEYVEAEKSLRDRREERLSAPAWRRAKWWLLGREEE